MDDMDVDSVDLAASAPSTTSQPMPMSGPGGLPSTSAAAPYCPAHFPNAPHSPSEGQSLPNTHNTLDSRFLEASMACKCTTAIRHFLSERTAFDLIPESGKVIVFDCDLPVKLAFYALLEHEITSAPLWDSKVSQYVGMLTVTDFIDILRHYWSQDRENIKDHIEKQHIRSWREISKENLVVHKQLLSVKPSDDLLQITRMFLNHAVHRIPVVDPDSDSVTHILTLSRILKLLVAQFQNNARILQHSLESTRIGTFENVATVTEDTILHDVLDIMASRRITAVPVVDAQGCIQDVFSRADTIIMAKTRTYDHLGMPVRDALDHHDSKAVHTCLRTDTIRTVVDNLANNNVHRLIVIDNNNRVEGVVSVSDVFKFFVSVSGTTEDIVRG